MQIGAVGIEPRFRAAQIRADSLNQPPESARVSHFDQVRDFVRGSTSTSPTGSTDRALTPDRI
jgi:hypothetical protein